MKTLLYSAIMLWIYKLTQQRKYCQIRAQDIENCVAPNLFLVRGSEVRWK